MDFIGNGSDARAGDVAPFTAMSVDPVGKDRTLKTTGAARDHQKIILNVSLM